MAYVDEKYQVACGLFGKRIVIPVHYDLWMCGARFGTVTSIGPSGEFIRVKMDHSQVRKRLKVWRLDFDYIKLL